MGVRPKKQRRVLGSGSRSVLASVKMRNSARPCKRRQALYFIHFFFFGYVRIEPRVLHMPGKYLVTESYPQFNFTHFKEEDFVLTFVN